MSAKLKKLSTSLEDVVLLSETNTCGREREDVSQYAPTKDTKRTIG